MSTQAERWWMVSDLHLSEHAAGDRAVADQFVAFLDEVRCARRPGQRQHVVLLGDSFELATWSLDTGAAVRDLADTVDGFPRVFDALHRMVRDGVHVHVVCGNHDLDLMRPTMRAELERQLNMATDPADDSTGRLHIHPWVLYVPGVLYAEHGHQHHALGRVPNLLDAWMGDGALQPPPLTAYARARQRGGGRVWTGMVVARAVCTTWLNERETRGERYRLVLLTHAQHVGLPSGALQSLQSVSAFRPGRAVVATAVRALRRRAGIGPDPNAFLRTAARRIDGILREQGLHTACYVFGHTHAPARDALTGTDGLFVNTGTWAHQGATMASADDYHDLPVVLIEAGGPHVSVRLLAWNRSALNCWPSQKPASAPSLVGNADG